MNSIWLKSIKINRFKNYLESGFDFGPKINLVTGLNGLGKTNLLDAVYYLCMGKSYIQSLDQRNVRKEEEFFRLDGLFHRMGKDERIEILVRPGISKEIRHQGIPLQKLSDYVGFAPVVFSAPKDYELISGTSQVRRRYLDHLICQLDPQYMASLIKYNQILSLRNAALKQGFSGLMTMLETYDEQMDGPANYIVRSRTEMISKLQEWIKDIYHTLTNGTESVEIEYESELKDKRYIDLASKSRRTDVMTQRSSTGVHRDDFLLSIKNMPAREYGSQGQIKSLIFSLHISKYILLREKSGLLPVFILDDIFDKLDAERLKRLLSIVIQPDFGQIFISDTSHDRIPSLLEGSVAQIKLS